jgi:hypothetical protein
MRTFLLTPLLVLAVATLAQAEAPRRAAANSAAQHSRLKEAFESFRIRLAILAARLEASDKPVDKERANRIKKVLNEVKERGTDSTLELLIRGLAGKNADKDLDMVARAVKENKKLSEDLAQLIKLLTEEEGAALKKRMEELKEILAKLKALRAAEARLQAKTDLGKADPKELAKEQDELAKETKDALNGKNPSDKVKDLVGKAADKEGKAGKLLNGGKPGEASDAQGGAIRDLDDAIRDVEREFDDVNRTNRGKKLRDLLSRVKEMLRMQTAIRDGIDKLYVDIRLTKDEEPTLAHHGRASKLAKDQTLSLRAADITLTLLREDATGLAFIEGMEQVKQDMNSVASRLDVTDVGKVTQKIADDIVESLKDMVKSLEKEIEDNDKPPKPPGPPGPSGDPGRKPLVNLLQQLKMVSAMQKRVNGRTALYGRRYEGEQAPMPTTVKDAKERRRLEIVQKELAQLAGRQASIRKVTRGLVIQAQEK